jgi:NAD(P)-dependent dehydrogenase (short-subunit alcohol dehydrogenase family)
MPQWTHADLPNLADHVVLVTGANSGLGLETAKALAAKGAQVIMACRDLDKAIAAVDQVRAITPSARLVVRRLDLAARPADQQRRRHGPPRRLTADGFELQLGTNHLGHFALTGLLLPALRRGHDSRVVTVSSTAHRLGNLPWDDLMGERRYDRWRTYGLSKLANLLFRRWVRSPRCTPPPRRAWSGASMWGPTAGSSFAATQHPSAATRGLATRPTRSDCGRSQFG